RKAAEDWNAKYEFVRTLVEQSGLWLDDDGQTSGSLSSAVVCTGITSSAVNRMICRKNFAVPSCASDWYIRTVRKKR
ncbi:MAG: hypothetical protein IJ828_09945, partial [Treponema sp.]|nr:hypothetical protein [Treponema sp.]